MADTRFDRIANLAIVVAAGALVVTLLRREFGPKPSDASSIAEASPPAFYTDWDSLDSVSLPLDTLSGAIKVYVFSDMECPFCAVFHKKIVPSLYTRFPRQVSVRLVHLPLRSHRFSRQAATALECAAAQGAALPFLDTVYNSQDSIGLIAWNRFASDAKVSDPIAFNSCMQSSPNPRIQAGEDISARFDVMSTPTIIVNGWRFVGLLDSAVFLRAIESIQHGVDPVVTASVPNASLRRGKQP